MGDFIELEGVQRVLCLEFPCDDFLFFLRRGNYRQGQKQNDLLENYCNNLVKNSGDSNHNCSSGEAEKWTD